MWHKNQKPFMLNPKRSVKHFYVNIKTKNKFGYT